MAPDGGGKRSESTVEKELQQIDFYRDTPIRFLGYANEVGEAFRSMIPSVAVKATYVVAMGYVCADALDKSRKVHMRQWKSPDERNKLVALAAADTFVWQALASVAIPGFTINRLCHFTGMALKRTTRWPPSVQKWTTTLIGLAAIPFIVKPIDTAVEVGMDRTIRTLYPTHSHE
ncbi:unnamed protein product, partial [Mesorhabditis spiculigera]